MRRSAVHANMKGRVGTYASMGKGAVVPSTDRIKLNTTISSTETEIWFRSLREAIQAMLMRIYCIRLIKAVCYWRIMVFTQPERGVSIFTFDII